MSRICLCAALVIPVILTFTGSITAGTRSANCPSVYVLGSRGSGSSLSTDHGLGVPGVAFVGRLEQLVPGTLYWANPYDAVGVLSWNLRELANGAGAVSKLPGLGAYHASVMDGEHRLEAKIASIVGACGSSTQIVLTGYSQGAQITGDVYQRDLDRNELASIVAVVLFGDPYFNGGDRTADRGSFSGNRDGLLGTRPDFTTGGGKTIVLSYCHSHDPICQGLFFRVGPIATLDPGSLTFKQHTNYAKYGEPDLAALRVAVQVLPFPLPTVTETDCGASGAPLIDVTYNEVHTVGTNDLKLKSGRYWAYLNDSVRERIWQTGQTAFCAREDISGTWTSVSGLSPGGTGTIRTGVTGTYREVEVFPITGTYDPHHPPNGNIGTFNLACKISADRTGVRCSSVQPMDEFFKPGDQYGVADAFDGRYISATGQVWWKTQTRYLGDITS